MKQTIFKCVTAILCVIALCITGSVCVGKIADAELEAAKKATESASSTQGESVDTSVDTSADTSTDVEAPVEDTATDSETPTDAEAPVEDSSATPNTPATSDKPASDNKSTAPKTAAEITKYYNDAVNKAVSAKAGFNKVRTTTLGKLNGGKLLELEVVVNTVNDFLAVGTTNSKNTKGKSGEIGKSSLTANDVSAASCTLNGDVYTITMTLKTGKSTSDGTNHTETSPLAKCGLYVGKGDNSAFDYKSGENIWTSIDNADNASVKFVTANTITPKLTAKVNAKTGNLVSINVDYNWNVFLEDVKYLIIKMSADGEAKTSIAFSNFVY